MKKSLKKKKPWTLGTSNSINWRAIRGNPYVNSIKPTICLHSAHFRIIVLPNKHGWRELSGEDARAWI